MYLSKSSLKLYENCPLAWKMRYVDRLKPPSTAKYRHGLELHDILNKFFDCYTIRRDVPVPLFSVRQHYAEEFRFFVKNEQERYKRLLRAGKPHYFMPVAREIKCRNSRLKLFGIIDRIDRNTDNGYTLVEYKTSSRLDDELLNNFIDDMAFYTVLLEGSQFNINKWHIIVTGAKKAVDLNVNNSLCFAMRERIEKVFNGIKNRFFEPAEDINACTYCDYVVYCRRWTE